MPSAWEVREMRNAAAGLVMMRAMLARGHWRAAGDRKTHEQFGEGPLEKYPSGQLAGGLLYRPPGSEGAGPWNTVLLPDLLISISIILC